MDGSVVIGVELNAKPFEAALDQLRNNAGQTLEKALTPIVQSLGSLSKAFSQSGAAGNLWSAQLRTAFGQTASGAAAMVPQLRSAGTSAGSAFLSGLSQTDTMTAGRNLAARAVTGFSAGSFSTAGYQGAMGIASGISSGGGSVGSAASALAARMRSAFSGGWYGVGYNISAGIASGVSGGSSLITSAAVAAAKRALAAAKQALGVQSPSRVFRDEVGKMIPAGMAQGIERGTSQVTEALRVQSAKIVETARQDVIPSFGMLPSGGETPVVSGKSDVHLTVEAPLILDGREMARATVRYTGEQLLWESL